jgi:glycosyltransferase involved in cell wall biosynthesis
VSEATLLDVHAYMGTPMERLALMHNGAEWPEDFAVRFENEVDEALVEPFVVILGTREPRKNIQRVFEMLSLFPELMERRRFVFVGKMGWLGEQTAVPEALRPALAAGRIHFTGFVSDYEKYKLLRAAEVSIYPSFFEGFGLPVLESIAVGTPCLSSWSSSLPEVGGEACLYFDPMSVMDMYRALNQFHGMTPAARARLTQRCLAAGAFLTWENAFDVVARRMMPHLETL